MKARLNKFFVVAVKCIKNKYEHEKKSWNAKNILLVIILSQYALTKNNICLPNKCRTEN